MAEQAQPETRPLTPAQTKRLQELNRRITQAQAAFNEFGGYLAEEHGLTGDDAGAWQLDVRRGTWVHVPTTPLGGKTKEG
jgi:hypothetical protein